MDEIPLKYLECLQKNNIDIKLLVKDKSILNDIRVKYFNFVVDFFEPVSKRPDDVPENAQFFSNKAIVDGENVYPSKFHWRNKDKVIDKPDNVVDNPLYWEDLEHFYIYERSQQSKQ
jgi:hypothetical protein